MILERKHFAFAVRYKIVNPFYSELAFISRLTTFKCSILLEDNSQCGNNLPGWMKWNLVMSTASDQCSAPRAVMSQMHHMV